MKHENIVLSIVVLGTIMASIDSTIVLLAFPAMTQALNSNIATMIWVILIYVLVTAVASMQLGRVGDIYGRSRMFNLGFGLFTLASFFCGLAPNDVLLIASRGLQAFGGALMSSNSGAIIADTFERHRMGKAYGYTSLGWNVGATLGIVLGGVITTFLGYRYIFFINVPIGIVALYLGLKYIKDVNVVKERLDLRGMLVLGAGLTLLSLGGVYFASVGLDISDAVLVAAGVLVILLFLALERRTAMPVINHTLLKNRVFRNSILASLTQGLGYMGAVFLVIMYLQGVVGLDPLYASLLLIPGYVISSLLSPLMGRYSDKYGARLIATTGLVFLIIALLVYLTLGVDSSVYVVIIGSIFAGFGGAMFWPANNSAVMASSDQRSYGSSSGLLRLSSGIGLLGSFVIVIAVAAAAIPRALAFQIFVSSSRISTALAEAFVTGMHVSIIALIVILVISAFLSLTRGKEDRHAAAHDKAGT